MRVECMYVDSMCNILNGFKREHTHVGSSSVAVSKGFYGLFKPNKNSQRCIFRFKSLQDHRFQNGNHRCWPIHMPEILCICTPHLGVPKHQKPAQPKSGGMSTVTWPAWNLGCIVHGTHPNISYCRMWHVSELGSLRWQQWQWSIARYFWQGKGPRIWKFLVTPLCTSILGFQLLSFLVSAEMIQLKEFNTQGRPEAKPSKQRPLLNLIQLYWNCTKEGFAAELKYVRLKPNQSERWLSQAGRDQMTASALHFEGGSTAPSRGTMQRYSQMRCSVIRTFALGSKRNRPQNHYAYFIQYKSSEHWFLFFAPTTVPLSSLKIGPCQDMWGWRIFIRRLHGGSRCTTLGP